MAIQKCHSARYHYDAFHNKGGDVINIGCNNTSIFVSPYDLGFGGYSYFGRQSFFSSFGSGLGFGLGQGIMNWLGNGLNGGGWNPMNIFGSGIMPWQQKSTFSWGGSTGRGGSAGGATSTSSHTDCVDSDRQLINQLGYKVNKLIANPNATKEDAVKLNNEIKKAKADTNDIHKSTDQKDYDNWMTALQNHATAKGWGNLNAADASTQPASTTPSTNGSTGAGSTGAGTTTTPSATGASAGATDGAGSPDNAGNAGATSTQAATSEPWNDVQNWGNNSLAKQTVTLPDGYSKISDTDNINEVKVTREIAGTMRDINGSTCKLSTEKVQKGGKDSNIPMYIAITSSESNKIFKYKYVGTTSDGNPVYATPASDKNKNVYVLAKKGNDFELIQLSGFTGHKAPDKQND